MLLLLMEKVQPVKMKWKSFETITEKTKIIPNKLGMRNLTKLRNASNTLYETTDQNIDVVIVKAATS